MRNASKPLTLFACSIKGLRSTVAFVQVRLHSEILNTNFKIARRLALASFGCVTGAFAQVINTIPATISDYALENVGSYAWMPSDIPTLFNFLPVPAAQYLCNSFVADMIEASGAPRPLVGFRTPSAAEWANPAVKIPGWEVVYPTSGPNKLTANEVMSLRRPGDVVATKSHMGIIVEHEETVSVYTKSRLGHSVIPLEFSGMHPTHDIDEYGSVVRNRFGWIDPPKGTVSKAGLRTWEEDAKRQLNNYTVRRYVGGESSPYLNNVVRDIKELLLEPLRQPREVRPYKRRKESRSELKRDARRAAYEARTGGCLSLKKRSGGGQRSGGVLLACDTDSASAMYKFSYNAERLYGPTFWWRDFSDYELIWTDKNKRNPPISMTKKDLEAAISESNMTKRIIDARVKGYAEQRAAEDRIQRAAAIQEERLRRIRADNQLRQLVRNSMNSNERFGAGYSYRFGGDHTPLPRTSMVLDGLISYPNLDEDMRKYLR